MHNRNGPGNDVDCLPDTAAAEFDHLLREIEKEAVPERLLELALQLQTALAERSSRRDDEGSAARL